MGIAVSIRMQILLVVLILNCGISIRPLVGTGTTATAFAMTSTFGTPLIENGIRFHQWPIFATTDADECNGIFESEEESIVEYDEEDDTDTDTDTVRVRIWRALASSSGEEITLKQLGGMVGERRLGELKSHLQHVTKQAKTIKNKNVKWRERRGLSMYYDTKRIDKLRIRIRRGKNNDVHVRLN
ncbi:MAG: hypothetical protein ACI8RD_006243 [Bacillariaceae sp.]|jgi:hypothetical protein